MDTDEMYFIDKAKSALSTDPSAAKSWIISAKTLYPTNFAVQVSDIYAPFIDLL